MQSVLVKIKQSMISRKKIMVVHQSLVLATIGVVYVVEITHAKKKLALLKVKSVNCGKMNHFSKVCRGESNNRSKSSHPKKPSKGKHHARSEDVEVSSGGKMSTLTSDDNDNSEGYTFNKGSHGHQTANLPSAVCHQLFIRRSILFSKGFIKLI